MLRKVTCNRMRKLIDIKGKVSLYFNQITFSYNQWLHLGSTQYKQFPQKKKKTKKDGRSLCGRKRKKENETWKKRRKEKRENERKEKERK